MPTREAVAREWLHLSVPPAAAVALLVEVAPQHGWQVVVTGDHLDPLSPPGKHFRLAAAQAAGAPQHRSGVFFSGPGGAYMEIGHPEGGLPEGLVAPLTAAAHAWQGAREGPGE